MSTQLELPISGMTCASCANRVERTLNTLDGVSATVNYATEKATVTFEPEVVAPTRLVEAGEAAGYTPSLPETEGAPAEEDATAPLRRRLIGSTVLSLPVLVLAAVPALQFDNWQWLSLDLATPVVLWGAWPFHRAAWASLRHGTATMDTLISVGTLAAYFWSVWALLFTMAGDEGMRMGFDVVPSHGGGTYDIYLETASVVVTLILTGRWFEERAKRRSGAALRAVLALGAKDVAVLRGGTEGGGTEIRVPIEQLTVGDRFVVR